MRKRLQRAAAIGMAAILCIQNAQFGLTTFADELSNFAKMEGIMNAQEMRVTPSDAAKNLPDGTLGEDSSTGENGEIKENPDGNSEGQENEQGDAEKASASDAKKDPVNRSEKSQILSWDWVDGEEYFVEGKILLSVGEEDQVSFDELITMLPTEISAEVLSEEETATAETIQIKNWTSNAYVQDSEGRWPTEGEFTFTAVLPEEYELAEETSPIEAVVSLDGDAVMEMEETEKQEILRVAAQDGTVVKYYLDKDGTLQRDDTNIEGVTVTQDSAPGKFQVDLSNIKLRRLIFKNKTFEVSLSGNV